MKNKPKKARVFKYIDSDEHLLFSSRSGNFNAGNQLLQKFFSIRYKIGQSVSPTIMKLLDSWEFNHAFFDSYNNAFRNYKHYSGATVRTYFSRIMKHALIAEASSNQVYQRIHTLSFDEAMYSSEGNDYALCDIVPAGEDVYSDVTYYINYMESVEVFLKKDFKLNEMDKAIIKLRADGLSFEDISQALSIPKANARNAYMKFYRAALKTIKTNSIDKIKNDLDKLL